MHALFTCKEDFASIADFVVCSDLCSLTNLTIVNMIRRFLQKQKEGLIDNNNRLAIIAVSRILELLKE
jgi:hypothetical protein